MQEVHRLHSGDGEKLAATADPAATCAESDSPTKNCEGMCIAAGGDQNAKLSTGPPVIDLFEECLAR